MSMLMLPVVAILALQYQAPPTTVPPTAPAVDAEETREFKVKDTCAAEMDTEEADLDRNDHVLLKFTSKCNKAVMVLVEPANPNRNPLECRATQGNPALGTTFTLRREGDLKLLCRVVQTAADGDYKYNVKACTVSSGESCDPRIIAPLAHELELHIPDK